MVGAAFVYICSSLFLIIHENLHSLEHRRRIARMSETKKVFTLDEVQKHKSADDAWVRC